MENDRVPDANNVKINSGGDVVVGGHVIGRDQINITIVPAPAGPGESNEKRFDPESNQMGMHLERLVHYVTHEQFIGWLVLCTFGAFLTGGFLWNVANILFGWRFHLGGSGNEPYGLSAFAWGAITISPVMFFALIACSKFLSINRGALIKFTALVTFYAILGGAGALFFYSIGWRRYIEPMQLGYGVQELTIAFIWALIIAMVTSLPFLFLGRVFGDILSVRYLSFQILLAILGTLAGVGLSLVIQRPISEVGQLRGLFAGCGLRLGLFSGVVASMWLNPKKPQPPSA